MKLDEPSSRSPLQVSASQFMAKTTNKSSDSMDQSAAAPRATKAKIKRRTDLSQSNEVITTDGNQTSNLLKFLQVLKMSEAEIE